jgi:hypothetical protein
MQRGTTATRRLAKPVNAAVLLACNLAAAACVPDSVAPGYYAADDAEADARAAVAMVDALDAAPPVMAEGGDAAAAPPIDASAAGPCDLTGRWLLTTREVATAIGAVEAAHTWRYCELTQSGSQVTVSKGLDCGADVRGVSSVAANVDYPKAWPALLQHNTDTGRRGTSAETASGCAVTFEKRYQVSGASASYADPSQTLPTSTQQATSNNPGWEDWDQDGNPGFTMNVTGLVTGQIYIVTRAWSAWSGSIAARATTFTLADDWNTEQDLLGYNAPPLLEQATAGVKDGDASQHFTVFARLGAAQATGDDTAICASIRSLAPTLAPSASN